MPAEQTSFDLWSSFQRVIPICTTADLDEEAAYEVRAFLDEVAATPDLIVLFDARGRSVWSSLELPGGRSRTEGGGGGDIMLRVQLGRALREMVPKEEPGEMMELG